MQRLPPMLHRAPWLRYRGLPMALLVAPLVLVSGCEFWPFSSGDRDPNPRTGPSSPFERSAAACPTACAMASASKHELSLLVGSEELPEEVKWGRTYVDGPGLKAFETCVGDEVDEQERVAVCLERAHEACISACVEAEKARVARRSERHRGRKEARKKAREKEQKRAGAPSP